MGKAVGAGDWMTRCARSVTLLCEPLVTGWPGVVCPPGAQGGVMPSLCVRLEEPPGWRPAPVAGGGRVGQEAGSAVLVGGGRTGEKASPQRGCARIPS